MKEQNPAVTPAAINAAINSAKNVNNYLCLSCNTVRMQAQNIGVVKANYRECWCKAGYGWTQTVKTNSNTGVKTFKKCVCFVFLGGGVFWGVVVGDGKQAIAKQRDMRRRD
jgi:hypothetical protein